MSDTAFFYGKDFSDKMAAFDQKVKAINERFKDQLNESLTNHFMITFTNPVKFNWLDTANEIPNEAKEEVDRAFSMIFPW